MAKRDNKYPARERSRGEKQGNPGAKPSRGGYGDKQENGAGRSEDRAARSGAGRPQNGAGQSARSGNRRDGGSGSRRDRESGRQDVRPGRQDIRPDRQDRYADRQNGYADPAEQELEENRNLIIGRNPVTEALKSGRQIDKLYIQKDVEGSGKVIAALARERKLIVQFVDKQALDRMASSGSHQGVAAVVSSYEYCEIEDILKAARDKGEDPLVILLDGLEDPHNLGAIMRTAEAVGAHGIVIPSRRSVSLTETVAKASAGAIEYVPVAKVANIGQAIELLQKEGLWVAACDMGGQAHYDADVTGPLGIVIGGEGQGVGRLVREKCDYVVTIPMKGKITSLNASNAAAVLLYEVYRQRENKRAAGKL